MFLDSDKNVSIRSMPTMAIARSTQNRDTLPPLVIPTNNFIMMVNQIRNMDGNELHINVMIIEWIAAVDPMPLEEYVDWMALEECPESGQSRARK